MTEISPRMRTRLSLTHKLQMPLPGPLLSRVEGKLRSRCFMRASCSDKAKINLPSFRDPFRHSCRHIMSLRRRCTMLLELSVIPLGRGRSISGDVAEMVKIVEASHLDYRLTATGTIIEGTWDQLMAVAHMCHKQMRAKTERVITLMKLDDYEDRMERLTAAVASVEAKLGKPVRK
jgi:uncharacterized protein (TIGR00106 family)